MPVAGVRRARARVRVLELELEAGGELVEAGAVVVNPVAGVRVDHPEGDAVLERQVQPAHGQQLALDAAQQQRQRLVLVRRNPLTDTLSALSTDTASRTSPWRSSRTG